jgi:hypothetical protein
MEPGDPPSIRFMPGASMATRSKTRGPDRERLLGEWLGLLDGLLDEVDGWAQALDWSTRRIEKSMADSEVGRYQAPALLMQREAARVLLEPIARETPGGGGLVDLYLLPAYDDIASLIHHDGAWHLHYPFPGSPPVGDVRQAAGRPLTKGTLRAVLDEMVGHAA